MVSRFFLVILALPTTILAQDLDVERRVELVEKQVKRLEMQINAINHRLEMVLLQLKDRTEKAQSQVISEEAKPTGSANEWVVRVSNITVPNTSIKRREISEAKRRLEIENERLTQERYRLQSELNNKANWIASKQKSAAAISERLIKKIQRSIRRHEKTIEEQRTRIAGLLRDMENIERNRVITGTTDDGQSVVIEANGMAANAAKRLKPGKRCRFRGRSRTVNNVLHIDMTDAHQVDGP